MRYHVLLFALVLNLGYGVEPAWDLPNPLRADVPGAGPDWSKPASFPDPAGLDQRAALIVDNLAKEDLKRWRTGYFAGGDPGKYLPSAAIAKLLKDPNDAMARAFMNDARSPTEHYHFAAVNWARFLPMFKSALSEDTLTTWAKKAASAGYIGASGTENHRVMTYSAGLVLAGYTSNRRFSNTATATAIVELKSWLKSYVKTLYTHGMGEWDSSTYLAFDLNGMLNVYDFGPDAESRAWARAALEFYVAGYALKYSDGIFCAPNQRGFAGAPAAALTDQIGWLWWGSAAPITAEQAGGFRYSLHALTSAWRPNAILTRIARRELPGLPLTQRNTKPNYWFGQQIAPSRAAWTETVTVAKDYTVGSLGRGYGGQVGRLQIVARTASGPLSFTGGSPIGRGDADGALQRYKYFDGNGRYDQTAQIGSTIVCLSQIPADETLAYACIIPPAELTAEVVEGWWRWRVGQTWIVAHGLTNAGELSTTDAPPVAANPAKKPKPPQLYPLVKFPGQRSGFVLMALPVASHADSAALSAALRAMAFAADATDPTVLSVALTDESGRRITVRNGDTGTPLVTIDGVVQTLPDAAAPVYSGPLVHLAAGILTVSDGERSYVVDTTGDLPVWRER